MAADAPRSIRQLANRLDHQAEYDTLYTAWSDVAHAVGFATFFRDGHFDGVRSPERLQEVLSLAAVLQLRSTRLLIDLFRKGENYSRWHEREIRDSLNRLTRMTVVIGDHASGDNLGTSSGPARDE